MRGLLYDYFVALYFGEHFFTFRYQVKAVLKAKLKTLKQEEQAINQLSPVS
ncbi:hypothetical protein [Tolypothrix sp. VBCCA 56010]|uniref:hypothetical protein n=1 Tax=Tolypothrix sp. VBCCA 56010 TaxID=3137731 RepID=UPI003D7E72DE